MTFTAKPIVWKDDLPCSAWDSRCCQYERLLRRASFLMQTAASGDPEMRKFIDEVEQLVGPEVKGTCPKCGCEEVNSRNLWTCECHA